jgi:hypothetical protein
MQGAGDDVNGVKITGLNEVIAELKKLPSSVDRAPVLEEVSEIFAARLRAATPPGYSGKLKDSVIYESSDDGAFVGYEQEVETAGNPALDSVIRPKTKGRSVLKWVSSDELGTVLEETFDAYAAEGVLFMEDRLVEQINGST